MNRRSKPPGFFQQHGIKIVVVVLVAIGLFVFLTGHGSTGAKRQVSDIVLLAPPPPPPPPPPPRPPPPKKMVEQTPVDKPEPKPQDNTPKSAPTGLPTNGKGGTMAAGGGGDGGGGGSRFGWYAASVQNTIHQALENNATTRHSSMGVTVRIWADVTGRITRAKLVNSTGNPSLDDALLNQVLLQTSLPGGPPPGMPMPINIRITSRS